MWTYEGIKRELDIEGIDYHYNNDLKMISFMVGALGEMPFECVTSFTDGYVIIKVYNNLPGPLVSRMIETSHKEQYKRLQLLCNTESVKGRGVFSLSPGFDVTDNIRRFFIQYYCSQNRSHYINDIFNYEHFQDTVVSIKLLVEGFNEGIID